MIPTFLISFELLSEIDIIVEPNYMQVCFGDNFIYICNLN
jgi:hypothetical protein